MASSRTSQMFNYLLIQEILFFEGITRFKSSKSRYLDENGLLDSFNLPKTGVFMCLILFELAKISMFFQKFELPTKKQQKTFSGIERNFLRFQLYIDPVLKDYI